MIAQANVTNIVIGKDDDLATSSETRNDLIAGQIGVFLVGSLTAKTTALTAGQRFQIVYKRVDGALIESPVIDYSNIIDKQDVGTPVAEAQGIKALGFNGTSGSIDVANGEDYVVHYNWNDNTKTFGRGLPTKFLAYRSSSSATQVEIAAGLVENAVANNSREKVPVVVADLLVNSAGLALGTGVDTITLLKGSKLFTATDIDDATGNAALAVGDYLRVGTAITAVCYEITAIDIATNTGTLAYAYQGDDYSAVDTSFERIAAATAATSDAGVILTGQIMPFKAGKLKYSPVFFNFWKVGEGFGATTVSEVTKPSKGIGTYKEIAEIEWFLRGNRGESYRVADYPVDYTADAVSGKTYQQITVSYKDLNAVTLDREVASFGALMIATEDESASTVHTDLKTVLGL